MISNWYGIREALAIASAEGLEAMWARHRKVHLYMWEELSKLGLEPFVEKEQYRLVSVNTIKVCCTIASSCCSLRPPGARRAASPCMAAILSAASLHHDGSKGSNHEHDLCDVRPPVAGHSGLHQIRGVLMPMG